MGNLYNVLLGNKIIFFVICLLLFFRNGLEERNEREIRVIRVYSFIDEFNFVFMFSNRLLKSDFIF